MRLDDPTKDDLVRVAHALADAARPETLRLFRTIGLAVDDKSRKDEKFDPVTAADRAAEATMRDILATARPEDGIIGEEFGTSPGTSGLSWVLDPIDGTRGFLCGAPTWGMLIAVSDGDGPLYGLIDQPFIAERFSGGFGQAAYTGPHGQAPLATRKAGSLENAVLTSTFPEIGSKPEEAAFRAVAEQVKLVRYGMDCYGYALLAAGQIDLVIEAGLHPYDIHAPIAVITAAGGIVTDWQGGPAHDGGRVIAAANPQVHAAALAILRDHAGG